MLEGYSWNMDAYSLGLSLDQEDMLLTQQIAEQMFRLDPPPPELREGATENDFILQAQEQKELRYFSFFLHHYEHQLNCIIKATLADDADVLWEPDQLMEIKMGCLEAMLNLIESYDHSIAGASFATYIYHTIRNVVRKFQMYREGWSFSSLSSYKKLRTAGYYLHNSQNPVEELSEKFKCDPAAAEKALLAAKAIHSREEYYIENDDGEIVGEMGVDYSWNYAAILWNGMRAETMQRAFFRLTTQDQCYLEARNAICMGCGKTELLSRRLSFQELGEAFEFQTANGAEKAYHRALDQLARNLLEERAIRMVTLKQEKVTRRKKKIAAAVYRYQADCDGEWGEIQFDFDRGRAEILRLAEWDTTRSQIYAKTAIEYILSADQTKLPKEKSVGFER